MCKRFFQKNYLLLDNGLEMKELSVVIKCAGIKKLI